MSDLELIALDAETAFVTRPDGRIEVENEPTPSPAPRMFLAGCAEGNVLCLRHDLPGAVAAEIERRAREEPPFADADARPANLGRYLALLEAAEPEFGLTFALPRLDPRPLARFVFSGSRDGDALLARLTAEGAPAYMADAGFGEAGELWTPWVAARLDGEIAALAFAARLGARGAALGLYTFPAWRGRGLGAAVTAAWTAHPELTDRTLFYGCARENTASRRVTERLGLRFIGPTLRLA